VIARETPILFVLGPSGSGKSTLGRALAAHGFHHLELDRWAEGTGGELANLVDQLNALGFGARIAPLAEAIEAMPAHQTSRGTVVTFASKAVMHAPHRASIEQAGIAFVVLYGSGVECMEGFIRRERSLGRALGPAHWIANNAQAYALFSAPDFAMHRIDAFRDGAFIGGDALVAAVAAHLAGRDPAWRDLASQSAARLASAAERGARPQAAANRR
jgi:energy-coupling factor transporter ATP-binding protein EcfA2